MLRVTVEMLNYGNENDRSLIGQFDITNTADHHNHPVMSNYHVKAKYRGEDFTFKVKNHRRSDGALTLTKSMIDWLKRHMKKLKEKEECPSTNPPL